MIQADQFLEWVEAGGRRDGLHWRIERKKGRGVAVDEVGRRAGDSGSRRGTSAQCAVGPSRGCKKRGRTSLGTQSHEVSRACQGPFCKWKLGSDLLGKT